VRLADHGVFRDSESLADLTRCQALAPQALELLHALICPHHGHAVLQPFRVRSCCQAPPTMTFRLYHPAGSSTTAAIRRLAHERRPPKKKGPRTGAAQV
jgi:hypothetical protein